MADPYRIISSPVRLPGELRVSQLAALVSVDALCRRARAMGRDTVWVPLTLAGDLAGQHATERELAKEGFDRATLGREAFVERVRERDIAARARLAETVASLGVEADIEASAIDAEPFNRAASTAFVRLFEQGRLQQMDRVVDTCSRCETVVDVVDGEVGDIELDCPVVELLLDGGAGVLRMALVAPELLLGAVAVLAPVGHPAVGSEAMLPIAGRAVPVVEDAHDGLPALLVPAHCRDHMDLARILGLTPIDVLDADGVVRVEGPLEGLPRYAARAAATALLTDEGLVLGTEPRTEAVSRCRRCGTVLVPRLGRHWFLAISDLEVAAADAVRDGAVSFSPPSARDEFLARAGVAGEWCLSHQVWAGQPVPVAQCLDCGQVAVAVDGDTSCGKCMGMLTADDSVLDARFVGAVAVLAAAGWPDTETGPAEMAPWTTLVVGPTGVARWALPIVALSVRLAGVVPCRRLAVHQAPDGEMAVGEVQELIDRFGASAVRVALVAGGVDLEAACHLVDLIHAPPEGEASVDELQAAWDAAFEAGAPATALATLASTLTTGVERSAATRVLALAAPVLGA